MKISCTQDALAKGLGIVGRFVAVRSPQPIASFVLITDDKGRIRLTGSNFESITTTVWIDGMIEEEGAIAVPARLIGDFVSTLPNELVSLTVPPRSRQAKLACARNEASISGMDAQDYPELPDVSGGASVTVDVKSLKQGIAQTVFAAATDDSRPVLTGVNARFEDGLLTLAASDGFRLSVHKLDLEQPVSEPVEIIVPARALLELNRLLGDDDETITLSINAAKTQVLFRLSSVEMVAQLIQGSFPNFNQLIPSSQTSRAVVNVSEFLRETRIASVFARDGSGIVRLVVIPADGETPAKIVISAKAEEVGDNEGEIDAVVEGEGVKIAFNGKYLQDVLQVLEGQLAMETSGPSSQGVFKLPGNDNYTHVIMPMFVQW